MNRNERYNFDEYIERRNTDCVKWDGTEQKFGESELLPFWVADSDFQAPHAVLNALSRQIDHGIFGYARPSEGFFDSIVSWFEKRHQILLQRDWISYSPGVVTGLTILIRGLTEVGDRVIIQTPVYYPFFDVIRDNSRVIEENRLLYSGDGKYRIDFEDLESKAANKRTKLLIVCSPHNPVSRVWTAEELTKIGKICLKHGVVIVSDDIHSDIVFAGNEYTSFLSLEDEIAHNSITLVAPSKTFNLAGLKLSAVLTPNETLLKKYNKMLQIHRVSGMNCLSQVAFEAAFFHGESYLNQLLGYLESNVRFVLDFIKTSIPGVKAIKPEGTFLMWLDCHELGLNDSEIEELFFRKARIALDSGHWFGASGSGFMRLNIACPRSTLEKGLQHLRDAIENEYL